MTLENFIYWYLSGLACSIFWMFYYFKNTDIDDWISFGKSWWIYGFFGPLAIIFSFPV